MNMEMFAAFLGWCAVLNIVLLLLVGLTLWFAHEWVGRVFGRMFGISPEKTKETLFLAFQLYRFAFAFFNLVPYIALRIMLGA